MNKFVKIRNIGKGNMGECALARNNEDGKYYVIKQVDLTKMDKKQRQQSLNEARVLSSLRHPNIIRYVDSFLARKSDHLCIVMEFADGGDLSSRMKKNYGVNFRETQVLDWFIQIVLSLHYVHQRKILHRDVKTQNVFLTTDGQVKLGDFGISKALAGTYDQAQTFVGTPYYLSPELILKQPYDHRSDIWAVGVVLYELLTLKHPFNGSDLKDLMRRILKVQYEPISTLYSTEMRNLVPLLLVKDPARRIRLADILELPMVHRRLIDWLSGEMVPKKYMDTLLAGQLLPESVLSMVKAVAEGSSMGSPPSRPTSFLHPSPRNSQSASKVPSERLPTMSKKTLPPLKPLSGAKSSQRTGSEDAGRVAGLASDGDGGVGRTADRSTGEAVREEAVGFTTTEAPPQPLGSMNSQRCSNSKEPDGESSSNSTNNTNPPQPPPLLRPVMASSARSALEPSGEASTRAYPKPTKPAPATYRSYFKNQPTSLQPISWRSAVQGNSQESAGPAMRNPPPDTFHHPMNYYQRAANSRDLYRQYAQRLLHHPNHPSSLRRPVGQGNAGVSEGLGRMESGQAASHLHPMGDGRSEWNYPRSQNFRSMPQRANTRKKMGT